MRSSTVLTMPMDLLAALPQVSPRDSRNYRHIISNWRQWAERAEPGSGEYRDVALRRLHECVEGNRTVLDLSGLALMDLPILWPDFIQQLNLNGNYLCTLPRCLPVSLESLSVCANQLLKLPESLPIHLINLEASENKLSHLPKSLPEGLKVLDVHHNLLTSLPDSLPSSLCDLMVGSNFLENLPQRLPDALVCLNAGNNRLSTLPKQLPLKLEKLIINNNFLKTLPALLPPDLEFLSASHNGLTYLPSTLPTGLQNVYIGHNPIKELPASMPMTLKTLYANNMKLTRLPSSLPSSITELNVSNNMLDALPKTLPSQLIAFSAKDNQLTALTYPLPEQLEQMNVENNPIEVIICPCPPNLQVFNVSSHPQLRIPRLWQIEQQQERKRHITFFIERITLWEPDLVLNEWEKIALEENARVFASFLERLYLGNNAQNPELKRRVCDWLAYLIQPGNSATRETTFLLAHEAAASCVDRASFYFNKMYCGMIENELIRQQASMNTESLIDSIRGIFRLQELEKIAAAHATQRRKKAPGFTEDIEIYLAYQYKLKSILALPIYSELQFGCIAQLTPLHLSGAVTHIMGQEKQYFLRYLLLESAIWMPIMKAWSQERMNMVAEMYLNEIGSNAFDTTITRLLENQNLDTKDEDARRILSKKVADDILYKLRFEMLQDYLKEKEATSILAQFDTP